MTTNAAARTASAPRPAVCPPWCVIDHTDDERRHPEDIFHRSAFAWLRPDGSRSGDEGPWEVSAQMVLPEASDEEASIVVDLGESIGPYAELDLTTADQFIRDLKAFTSHVQQLRDRLAALKEQQS